MLNRKASHFWDAFFWARGRGFMDKTASIWISYGQQKDVDHKLTHIIIDAAYPQLHRHDDENALRDTPLNNPPGHHPDPP